MTEMLLVSFYGNELWRYVAALSVFLGGLILIKAFALVLFAKLKLWAARTVSDLDDFLVQALERTLPPLLYFGTFYLALSFLVLPLPATRLVRFLAALIATLAGVRFAVEAVEFALMRYWAPRGEQGAGQQLVRGIMPLVKTLLWGLGAVFLLDNLGYEITTVIAGLGIGGVAVALAAQAVLGDLFSYFAIMFDRPFSVGDFIVVGDSMGTIENIGIKTTRVRSLGGEQLVFSNTDLTGSRVRNFKRMEKRRVVFQIGITYETPQEKVRALPNILRELVLRQKDVEFDRSHFTSFGDFALNFEVVYFVLSSDYNRYMDIHQQINFSIADEFEKRGIQFAYPTQTLYLNKAEAKS